MKTYATIDRIEGKFAVCEVELQPIEESNVETFMKCPTVWIDVSLEEIPTELGELREGDILIVEQDNFNVNAVYNKDEQEKIKRAEKIRSMNHALKNMM